MRTQQPGCLTPLGIIASVLSIGVIAGVILLTGGRIFSPGALSAIGSRDIGGIQNHAELSNRCSACHTPPWNSTTMTDQCLTCHQEIQAQIQEPGTVHGTLITNPEKADCRGCHTEHRGPSGVITRVDIENFPHEATGFSLKAHSIQGISEPLICTDCHQEETYHFISSSCTDCHSQLDSVMLDKHMRAFGSDCRGCHDGIETYGKAFDHSSTKFSLVGKHQSLDCVQCHAGMTTINAISTTAQDCAGCHQTNDPHQGEFGSQCETCHTPDGWLPAKFDHAQQTSFALAGKHAQVDCAACHVDHDYSNAKPDCASCHLKDDAHAGQFGVDCAACHSPEGWKPALFDHAKSSFPLEGGHQGVPCADCHQNGVYKGTPNDCYACHSQDDQHNGEMGTDCTLCHTIEGWNHIIFDHSQSRFPLTGGHAGLPCINCHGGGKFTGMSIECNACHADPVFHKGLFAANCSLCHSVNAWRPASFNQPHAFPLTHGGASSCRDCHAGSLASWTCYGCHALNDIAGEHNEEGISDLSNCIACHAGGGGGEGHGGGGGGDD